MGLMNLLEPPETPESDENQNLPKNGFASIEELPAAHVRLFAPFILEVLKKNPQQPFLSEDEIAKLEEYFTLNINEQACKLNPYFFQLTNTDKKAQRFAQFFIDNPCVSNEGLDKCILMQPPAVHPEAFDTYVRYILFNKDRPNLLDCLCNVGYVGAFVRYFSHSNEQNYRNIAMRILPEFDSIEKQSLWDLWRARCFTLISLISSQPRNVRPCDWIFEYLKACNMFPQSRAIAWHIDPDFDDILNLYSMRKDVAVTTKSGPMKDFFEGPVPTSPRPQSDYPRPGYITHELCDNIALRKYQEELTVHAKRGVSTVICAPTGSGKTIVAADIILNHLRENISGIRRAVMFVPTIPLVSQQAERFDTFLKPQFLVTQMSGAEKAKAGSNFASTVLQADICVMTPQIFINMLMSPLKSQKLFITDFTLFIFDECHHCTAAHPYNVLMDFVRASSHKPQIVGLTASVGDGQSGVAILSANTATEHIIELCARLNVSTIASIRDPANMEELSRYVPTPIDEIISVRPNPVDQFSHKISKFVDDVYHTMLKPLEEILPDISELTKNQIELQCEPENGNGQHKLSIGYGNKVAMIFDRVNYKTAKHSENRQFCLKCLDLIRKCVFALRQNSLLPASYAFDYLVDEINRFKQFCLYSGREKNELGQFMTPLNNLMRRFEILQPDIETFVPTSNKKPILDRLFSIITDQFKRQPESRVIIFVEMRLTCEKLMNVINEHSEIKSLLGENAARNIVSVNQSTSQFGQNISEQQDILNMFRQGKVKILVATSVAEEGIDVADCNLVIKYNNCGSEKSYVQRKGRGRAMNSRSVLLALDSTTELTEYRNIRREYLMKMCVRHLQSLGEKELRARIVAKIRDFDESAKLDAERDSYILKGLENWRYVLRCSQCNTFICYNTDVRRLSDSQFVCCRPICWKDTSISPRIIKHFGNSVTTQCGDWVCKCGKKRGEVLKYAESFLPSLHSDGFRVCRERNGIEETAIVKKLKWKDVQKTLFVVAPVSADELREMANALYEYKEELYNQAVSNEVKGLQNACLNSSLGYNKPVYRLQED